MWRHIVGLVSKGQQVSLKHLCAYLARFSLNDSCGFPGPGAGLSLALSFCFPMESEARPFGEDFSSNWGLQENPSFLLSWLHGWTACPDPCLTSISCLLVSGLTLNLLFLASVLTFRLDTWHCLSVSNLVPNSCGSPDHSLTPWAPKFPTAQFSGTAEEKIFIFPFWVDDIFGVQFDRDGGKMSLFWRWFICSVTKSRHLGAPVDSPLPCLPSPRNATTSATLETTSFSLCPLPQLYFWLSCFSTMLTGPTALSPPAPQVTLCSAVWELSWTQLRWSHCPF